MLAPGNQVILSEQQQAAVDWARDGSGSAFVEAVAGAGKTTLLIQMLKETRGSVAFAAYNRKIADEIKAKTALMAFGNRVRVGTFHSFGLNAWRRIHPNVKSGPEAARDKDEMTVANFRKIGSPEALDSFVLKLVGLAKQRAIGLFGAIEDQSLWYDIVEHFDLAYEIEDEALIEQGVQLATRTLRWQREISNKIINFDDMIYMPIVTGCRMWENDWVLVDEAQDTNPARRALARKMLRRGGRAVFVGDRHQAIYGFTGADNDAIDQIVRDFNCRTLPLTVTFRCPKAVVTAAQEVVSHIQAHDTAPEGVVRYIDEKELVGQDLQPHDAILCRKTKPLVDTAFALIRKRIPCHVEGRDIGLGLLKLVNRWQVRSLEQLKDRLAAYAERETLKLRAKGRESQAEALQDRVDTLVALADGCQSVDELRTRIVDMFQDGDNEPRPTLTLSTVHRSKGREWGRVFVLGRNVWMPGPWARQQWELEQESNLIYVAYTRAKQELVLVDVVEAKK